MTHSTPTKVLEEKWKATTEDVLKIGEKEVLCAKAVEQVSQSWEALIDDTDLKQVTQQLHTAKADINKLKNEQKKLPIMEKMTKAANFKRLQQQVAGLWI